MFKRYTLFLYGVSSYALFLATFVYALGFVGNFLVPVTLDGAPRIPLGWGLLIDLVLLSAFALQHSVMARPFFKRWLTRFIPEPAERSTYVLCSSLALIALFSCWQPLGGVVWEVQAKAGRALLGRKAELLQRNIDAGLAEFLKSAIACCPHGVNGPSQVSFMLSCGYSVSPNHNHGA